MKKINLINMFCSKCNKNTLHNETNIAIKNNKKTKYKIIINKTSNEQKILICQICNKFSVNNSSIINKLPNPSNKMDEDLKIIYNEARNIVNYSIRSGLGLLRCVLENLLIRKFNIPNGTKLNEILKKVQVIKLLGNNIIDSANNFKNVCNSALHSYDFNSDTIKNDLNMYFDWINKLSWILNDEIKIKPIEIKQTDIETNKVNNINSNVNNELNKKKNQNYTKEKKYKYRHNKNKINNTNNKKEMN